MSSFLSLRTGRSIGYGVLARLAGKEARRGIDIDGPVELRALDAPSVAARRREEARDAAAAVPEHNGLAGVAERAHGGCDVVGAEAQVMQTLAVLLEPPGQRRVAVEGLDELQ